MTAPRSPGTAATTPGGTGYVLLAIIGVGVCLLTAVLTWSVTRRLPAAGAPETRRAAGRLRS